MKIRILAGVIVLTLIGLFFNSCQTDDLGGSNDNTDSTTKFTGTWNVSDQPARINYSVTIEKHEIYKDQVKLINFADAGGVTIAIAYGNTLVIDKQQIGSGFSAEGTGLLSEANEIKFEFSLDDGIDNELRKATFTK